MEDSRSKNNKRIAKNTFLLYFRMLFIMAISLYTSRVVLHELGVRDFGIYNVVGGVVAMFTILSGSLSSSISRFLNIELGRNDRNGLKEVFVSSVNIQLFQLGVAMFDCDLCGKFAQSSLLCRDLSARTNESVCLYQYFRGDDEITDCTLAALFDVRQIDFLFDSPV